MVDGNFGLIKKLSVLIQYDNSLQNRITIRKVKSAHLPRILKPPGITRERQEYLHTQIVKHVWPEYRAITCPPPQ